MNTYFETSALIKLVVAEEGSDRAGAIWDGSDVVLTSRLSYAEARAALAAGHRARRLSAEELAAVKRALETRFREIDLIEVSDGIVRLAGDLAERLALRGYDAVHLASALAARTTQTTIATWDHDLACAAHAEGIDVVGALTK